MKTKLLSLCFAVFTFLLQAQTDCYDYPSGSYTPPDAQIPVTSVIPYAAGYASLTAWVK
jgi:hypothetical protein